MVHKYHFRGIFVVTPEICTMIMRGACVVAKRGMTKGTRMFIAKNAATRQSAPCFCRASNQTNLLVSKSDKINTASIV